MPDIEIWDLEQWASLWMFLRSDGHGGPVVGPAQAIRVRWSFTQTEMMSPQNATISCDAQVVVAQQVLPDSLMWLGLVQSLANPALGPQDPSPFGLFQVKAYMNMPSLKNRSTRWTLGLVRWRGSMPAGVG